MEKNNWKWFQIFGSVVWMKIERTEWEIKREKNERMREKERFSESMNEKLSERERDFRRKKLDYFYEPL